MAHALDPQLLAIIERNAAAGVAPTHTLTPVEARRALRERVPLLGGPPVPVAKVEDRVIPGPGGDLPVRVYAPGGTGPKPVLVYFHGGGWVLGDLDSHDNLCRYLANFAECLVVSVDYRLAPEHRFPAAAEDACASTRWVLAHAADLGGDPARVAVGGDSAGGNLAAVVALRLRDECGPALSGQLLIYPMIEYRFDRPSYREFGSGYMLSREDIIWFWHHYLADPAEASSPLASPIRAESLEGLPPALVLTAGYDPLRDEGEDYAQRLSDAGVQVVVTRYPGMVHGFIRMQGVLDEARRASERTGRDLRSLFWG